MYVDERAKPTRLDSLTPMDLHNDERWMTRDLPRIRSQGLHYPLLVYPVTVDYWYNRYTKLHSGQLRHAEPRINPDGMIHAVKVGSNRYQCACYLGYETIDAIMFDNQIDCIKLGIWLRDCDPLNNKNAPPYQGLFSYDNL